jgi:hypothetical protein
VIGLSSPINREGIYIALDIIAILRTNNIDAETLELIFTKFCTFLFKPLASELNDVLNSFTAYNNIDPDLTQLPNLLSLTFNKQNATKDDYKNLSNKQGDLRNFILTTVDPNITTIFGNTQFNTQIMLSNQESLNKANEISKYHNLTIINGTDCVKQLQKYYNIDSDILIAKSEEAVLNVNKSNNANVTIEYYDLQTRKQLNKSICKSDKDEFMQPILMTPQENAKYNKLKKEGIDMYNTHDPAFRTKCIPYVDPYTQYDTTLSYRLKNYFVNRTECLINNCAYTGLDAEGYIICSCDATSTNTANEGNHESQGFINVLSCAGQVNVKLIKIS